MDLIFELIAPRVGYKQSDSFVPEPAAFVPFDLRALERSYGSGTNSVLPDHALPALQAALVGRQQWRSRAGGGGVFVADIAELGARVPPSLRKTGPAVFRKDTTGGARSRRGGCAMLPPRLRGFWRAIQPSNHNQK